MKAKTTLSIALIGAAIAFISCTPKAQEEIKEEIVSTVINLKKVQLKEVIPQVFETEIFTDLDYKNAGNIINDMFDSWQPSGCSAAAKILPDGSTIVGRNLDFFITNKPAFVVRTKNEKGIKTIGLVYMSILIPDYEDVKKDGLPEVYYNLLPFLSLDVLNSEGLYIEVNMRYAEYYPTGQSKFECSGTNPDSKERVYAGVIARHVAENCRNVKEAIEYIKTLDIYTSKDGDFPWNFGFILADASGNYGVLEIAENKISFLEKEPAQTNFYLTPEFARKQGLKCGVGRYTNLTKVLSGIKTEDDMFQLMDSISYFQSYFPEKCSFDARSEYIGEQPEWTYDYIMAKENQAEVTAYINEQSKKVRSMTRKQLQDDGSYWESSCTNVVNCSKKTIRTRFFEDDSLILNLSFDF